MRKDINPELLLIDEMGHDRLYPNKNKIQTFFFYKGIKTIAKFVKEPGEVPETPKPTMTFREFAETLRMEALKYLSA